MDSIDAYHFGMWIVLDGLSKHRLLTDQETESGKLQLLKEICMRDRL